MQVMKQLARGPSSPLPRPFLVLPTSIHSFRTHVEWQRGGPLSFVRLSRGNQLDCHHAHSTPPALTPSGGRAEVLGTWSFGECGQNAVAEGALCPRTLYLLANGLKKNERTRHVLPGLVMLNISHKKDATLKS